MKRMMLLMVALLFAGAQTLSAQRTITGTVISADDNMTVPGASVSVRGTTIGTMTDINGRFALNVPADATHLVFSFMGMETQTVEIGGRTTIDVRMASGALMMQEFIVTGYGVSRRASFTGTATQVGADVLTRQVESNVINALQGTVPGLQVSNTSGQPGSASTVRIRGIGSVNAATAPLFVVDGVPITQGSISGWTGHSNDPFASLNPDDIESITVLRDAAATSIFGARASNGVILVTTRRGQEGRTSFNVSLRTGVVMSPQNDRRNRTLSLEDYEEWLILSEMAREELLGSGNPDRDAARLVLENLGYIGTGHNTDWLDAVTHTGTILDATVSASGGTARGNYFLSVGWLRNESYVIGSDFERFTARANVEMNADRWITMGANISGTHSLQNQTASGFAFVSPLFGARMLRRTEPIRNDDGEWNFATSFGGGTNPVAVWQDDIPNRFGTRGFNAVVSPYIRVQILDNLLFQTRGGLEANLFTEENFWSLNSNDGRTQNMAFQRNDQRLFRQNITNTINWMPTFRERHQFNLMLGQEAHKLTDEGGFSRDNDFADPRMTQIMPGSDNSIGQSWRAHSSLLSYFGSIEYELDDKYYLSATIRRDASSRFAPANRWGTFYSVGAKWRISHEPFFQPLQRWIDNLTLRTSIGTSGNQPGAWFGHRTVFNLGGASYSTESGMAPAANPGNDDLRWERQTQFDAGFALTALGRLELEVVFYNAVTRDLLYPTQLSRTTGGTSILTNFASLRNRGVEISANAMLLSTRDFRWTVGATFTANRNKVLDFGFGGDSLFTGDIGVQIEGMPFGLLWLPEWGGVCPATGLGGWVQPDGAVRFGNTRYHGSANRVVIDPNARFYGGFDTRLTWRNFDFSAHFFYSVGSRFFSNDMTQFENTGQHGARPPNYFVFDNMWRQPGDRALVPRSVRGFDYAQGMFSTRHVMNGTYFRLRSLTLGYTLPADVLQRIGLQTGRVFVAADNLWTLTHREFRGWEPDAGLAATQAGTFGQPRNFTVGLNVGF